MENQTLLQKIRSVKYCLMAHPDNEPDSEFADRIDDLQEIEDSLIEHQARQQPADLFGGLIEDLKALKQNWIERAEQNEFEYMEDVFEARIKQVSDCIDIANNHANIL